MAIVLIHIQIKTIFASITSKLLTMKKLALTKLALVLILFSSCASEEIATKEQNAFRVEKTTEMKLFENSIIKYGKNISENPLSKDEAKREMKESITDYLSVYGSQIEENKTEGQLLIEALNQHAEKLKELNSTK